MPALATAYFLILFVWDVRALLVHLALIYGAGSSCNCNPFLVLLRLAGLGCSTPDGFHLLPVLPTLIFGKRSWAFVVVR